MLGGDRAGLSSGPGRDRLALVAWPMFAEQTLALQAARAPDRCHATCDRTQAMPRFAANLSYLFNEVPFLDRFEAAARAGFHGHRIRVRL